MKRRVRHVSWNGLSGARSPQCEAKLGYDLHAFGDQAMPSTYRTTRRLNARSAKRFGTIGSAEVFVEDYR